jgi:hypothetical protein
VNSSSNLIAIVPNLPPVIDGVGDYAMNIARQLRQDFDIQTHFIVGSPTWEGSSEIEGFTVSKVSSLSSDALIDALSDDRLRQMNNPSVLLQYVGYGYAKRGCPKWLIEGLRRWKSSHTAPKIVTMFHEVYYGSGFPWNSSFWLSSLQKKIVFQLVEISSQCITSNQYYVDLIKQISEQKLLNVVSVPVFSNVGEPTSILSLAERSKRIVVFGHRNARAQVYHECKAALKTICNQLNIEEIYDIGVPTNLNLSTINGIPIVEKGITEAREISKILQDSIAGFLSFPLPKYLAKSTVFSAYCAHGVIPCMNAFSPIPIDNMESGKHYWSYHQNMSPLTLEAGQEIASQAHSNYQTHNLSTQARIFATHLGVCK